MERRCTAQRMPAGAGQQRHGPGKGRSGTQCRRPQRLQWHGRARAAASRVRQPAAGPRHSGSGDAVSGDLGARNRGTRGTQAARACQCQHVGGQLGNQGTNKPCRGTRCRCRRSNISYCSPAAAAAAAAAPPPPARGTDGPAIKPCRAEISRVGCAHTRAPRHWVAGVPRRDAAWEVIWRPPDHCPDRPPDRS